MHTANSVLNRLWEGRKKIDWKLLLFLVLFLNVKLIVKLAAIVLIYFLQPRFHFGFRLKLSRLPLFYPVVLLIAGLDLFLFKGYSRSNYLLAFAHGAGFWILCLLAIHQVKYFVEKNDPDTLTRTLICFFLINAAASAAEIFRIIVETGAINPYRYQGNYQKYFISTGDYIKGITFDTSTTNAVLNAFGILFFLYRRHIPMLLVCSCTLLLTASNLVNILLFLCLLGVCLVRVDKVQRSLVVICSLLVVVFAVRVSPQNHQYVTEGYKKLLDLDQPVSVGKKTNTVKDQAESVPGTEAWKEKIARHYVDSVSRIIQSERQRLSTPMPAALVAADDKRLTLPKPDIHSAPFQNRNDTNAVRKELLDYIVQHHPPQDFGNKPLPGKLIAFQQTARFLWQHPERLLTGNGMGNFSSKLAFKATGLAAAGGYPEAYTYVHPDFFTHHLAVYLYYFSKHPRHHSVTNSPSTAYNQLAGEYGMLGLTAFLLLYLGYFLKDYRKLTYGIPLILLLVGFMFMDYWFEQLSILILFELMLLLNQKETSLS
jgi:hypothetical protein